MRHWFIAAAFMVLAIVPGAIVFLAITSRPTSRMEPYVLAYNQLEPRSIDLGELYHGEVGVQHIPLTNTTGETLRVDASVSCGCTRVEFSQPILGPGETCEVTITFDTRKTLSPVGDISERIALIGHRDDRANAQLLLAVHANIRPSVNLTPTSVQWLWQASKSEFQDKTVKMTNESSFAATVRWIPGRSQEAEYVVLPSSFELQANHDMAVHIRMRMPETGKHTDALQFAVEILDPGRSVSITQGITTAVIVTDPVVTVPGALIFGRNEIAEDREKLVTLYAGSDADLILQDFRSRYPLEVRRIGDRQIAVRVAPGEDGGAINETLVIQYQLDGEEGQVAVPVLGLP